MISKRIIGGMVALPVLLTSTWVLADTTLKIRGSGGLKSTIQISNGKGRLSADGSSEYVLYDSVTTTITYVEPNRRQYTQLTAAELEATVQNAAKIKRSMAPYMGNLLAGLPAEQRRMIEQRFGGIPSAPAAGKAVRPADIRTVNRGKHTIAGLRCEASGILENGRPIAEVCMATAPSGGVSKQDFATLESLLVFSRSMAGAGGSLLGGMAEQFEFLAAELDGVPVAVHDLERGKRYQVTAVSNTALSDVLFKNYEGFRRQEIPNLFH